MIERRTFLSHSGFVVGGLLGATYAGNLLPKAAAEAKGPSQADDLLNECRPRDSMKALMAGNARFSKHWQAAVAAQSGRASYRLLHQVSATGCETRPSALMHGQAPWAAILTCADSRVSPEIVFDVSDGDLFSIRSAGNTAFHEAVASLEYAVSNLGVPLVLVVGHSSCGAVKAARASEPLTPLLTELVTPIRASLQGKESLTEAIQSNARYAAKQIIQLSSLLRDYVNNGKLTVRASYLDLTTGKVSLL